MILMMNSHSIESKAFCMSNLISSRPHLPLFLLIMWTTSKAIKTFLENYLLGMKVDCKGEMNLLSFTLNLLDRIFKITL